MRKIFVSVWLVVSVCMPVFAGDMSREIDAAGQKVMPQVIEWRRHIHQNPELSNREFKTAKFVEDKLAFVGNIEVRTGDRKNRCHRHIEGRTAGAVDRPSSRYGCAAGDRTQRPDVQVDGNVPNTTATSRRDARVRTRLARGDAARERRNSFRRMKDKIKGTVVFIFQPAEEGAPAGEEGGAALMVKEGVMDNPKIDAVFGIHINAQTEIGKINYKSGRFYGIERLVLDQGQRQTDARLAAVAGCRPDRRRDADIHRFANDRRPRIRADKGAGSYHDRQDQRRRSREHNSRGTDDVRHDPHARLCDAKGCS